MGYFYFTRHGQTFWNVSGQICGTTDIALTELGLQQAEELARKISEENIRIDRILCSPMQRARKTAEIIGAKINVTVTVDARLNEQCFGRFEGSDRHGEDFVKAKMNFIDSYDGGETMFHLAHRIYGLLDEITAQQDTVYLLVAHNGISRVVESYFRDMNNEEFSRYGIQNCSLKRYDY